MDSSLPVPMEDTIQALIDYLVSPLLPIKASLLLSSSLSKQRSLAQQMHAVVLLYNYYHRKQFPDLEFLGFESFCKVAVNCKPSLMAFMQFMQRCDKSGESDKQFSITEEMVMDACNICTELDASKDAPNIEGWPVSKVAVFVVDSVRMNCLLQFSSKTQGVWSLIEKDLNSPSYKSEVVSETCSVGRKKSALTKLSADEPTAGEAALKQLAFSAVKEKTGIDSTYLTVLESHLVYSLSKGKTTARFYLMQCSKPIDEEVTQVPIKDAIGSMKGPLVSKRLDAFAVTSVIEYFHLLPYSGILSDWLSRETTAISSKPSPKTNEPCTNEGNGTSDKFDPVRQIAETPASKTRKFNTRTVNVKENGYCSTDGSLGAVFSPELIEDRSSFDNSGQLCSSRDTINNVKDMNVERRKKTVTQKGPKPIENGIKYQAGRSDSVKKLYNADGTGIKAMARDEVMFHNGSSPGYTPLVPSPTNSQTLDKQVVLASKENDLQQSGLLPLKREQELAEVIDSTKKPCYTDRTSVSSMRRNEDVLFQNGASTGCVALVPSTNNSKNLDKVQAVLALKENDLQQSALLALKKKRDDLCHQHRLLEDEIALCEKNIQTIIGGEDDFLLKLETIIEACNAACSKGTSRTLCGEGSPQYCKKKTSSEAVLISQNPCQELDEICAANNWILPRYSVLLSDGGFLAKVIIQGVEQVLSDGGDLRNNPREARESAATYMLSKLSSMASQPQ